MFPRKVLPAVLVFLVFGVTAGFSMSLPPPPPADLPAVPEAPGDGVGPEDWRPYDHPEEDARYRSKYNTWRGSAGFSAAYDRAFTSDDWMVNIGILDTIMKSGDSRLGVNFGYTLQFAPGVFDLFLTLGLSFYPFKKVFSLSAAYGIGILTFYLNHYSYIAGAKAAFDIPLGKTALLCLAGGVRRRSAHKMINYFGVKDRYFRVCNSYFAEVSYRWRF